MTKPRVLILHATGTNRDREAAQAVELAGGRAEIVHVNQLRDGARQLSDYQMLLLPGGFSYGDDLGAGRLWASDLRHLLQDQVVPFVEAGKPVIGICNGFQALVKSGFLPGRAAAQSVISSKRSASRNLYDAPRDPSTALGMTCSACQGTLQQPYLEGVDVAGEGAGNHILATLTRNASNRFECRWVWLEPDPDSPCVFTRGMRERVYCPVAHGEGRFVPRDEAVLRALEQERLVALRYVADDGAPARYPHNPNGSVADVAGICNASGTVFGLMPHPEDHILPEQHPRWARGERGHLGLGLFETGIRYAALL